jgi:hypothetical protein
MLKITAKSEHLFPFTFGIKGMCMCVVSSLFGKIFLLSEILLTVNERTELSGGYAGSCQLFKVVFPANRLSGSIQIVFCTR